MMAFGDLLVVAIVIVIVSADGVGVMENLSWRWLRCRML